MAQDIHELVREHYASAALTILTSSPGATDAPTTSPGRSANCCGDEDDCCGTGSDCCTAETAPSAAFYTALERDELPDAAVLASLGCGNPIAVADLHAGERVLDLGSGGGIDVLLSARRVGPTGHAIGLDMTDEMLALARRNAADAGATNVEFLKGHIEAIPLPDASVDVVISNCVVNLAADKPAVFREIARVLRPGGRIGITDIVADDSLTASQRAERGSYAGCIAGALTFGEFESGLRDVGLVDVSVTPTQAVAEGMHSAIIRANRARADLVGGEPVTARVLVAPQAVDGATCC